ncbi:MAG: GYD domain-containing protein [Acidimicrobiales bacterium]|nr:GYD domain-containing protein [Acidimicrobiales bacterium]
MPKYLFKASFALDGIRGVKAKGGSARREALEEAARSVGGSLESLYFAFGDDDLYVTADLPDNKAAMALSLSVCSGGGGRAKTVVLLTPEEVDAAAAQDVRYRPPGA